MEPAGAEGRVLKAVVFDLYGTLLAIRAPRLRRAAARVLGVAPSQWMELVRGELLTRSFAGVAEFARVICQRLAPGRGLENAVASMVEEEIASVTPFDGASSLLAFLRRRGYALGVLSNLSSVHKEPLRRLGMDAAFDAAGFSCDSGVTKPDPRAYLDLCARLGVAPEETLVVGDSVPNDVRAPRALGMRALAVGAESDLPAAALLGFVFLGPGAELKPLLAAGQPITLGGRMGTLRVVTPLKDAQQGRYNLVATATFESHGDAATVFCKRYLFPEGAHVEAFAHAFLAALGMPACAATATPGPEPCLVASRAPGAKMEGAPMTAPLAVQVGRQAALAYLFANADLRPRNAFVSGSAAAPVLTMIDLEHCFFDLALDVSGIDDPMRPERLDRLGEDELLARVQRRVLTPRTMKRARRAFFGTDELPPEMERAFRDGWVAAYREVQAQAATACALLEERAHREPFLVIGTQAYRRALARVDIEETRRRLAADAEDVYARSFGPAAPRRP
jgi:HAD superfamily hydrolase (TIGR01509 family)